MFIKITLTAILLAQAWSSYFAYENSKSRSEADGLIVKSVDQCLAGVKLLTKTDLK
jgi:hypothetical protein